MSNPNSSRKHEKAKLILLFILLFGLNGIIYAQEKPITVSGFIKDAETDLPVKDANIIIKGAKSGTISNDKGYYKLTVKKVPAVLEFSHVSYNKQTIEINDLKSCRLDIELVFGSTMFPEVIISNKAKTVLDDKHFYVSDYEFYGDNILLIGYRYNTLPKLLLMTNSGDTLSYISIYDHPESLVKDCLGNIHLLTEKTAYQVFYDSAAIQLLYPIPLKEFNEKIPLCLAATDNFFYHRKYFRHNQMLIYFMLNRNDSSNSKFKVIVDDVALRRLDDRDRDIAMGKTYTEADLQFDEMCFFDPIFCPIAEINDTLYIFNYVDSKIEIFSQDGLPLREIPIQYHLERNFKDEFIIDEPQNKIYSLYRKNGISTLKEINLKTGVLAAALKIPDFAFVEKIKVHKGSLYFLYTNYKDEEKRMLFRMKI